MTGGNSCHVTIGGVSSGECSGPPHVGTGSMATEGHGSIEIIVLGMPNCVENVCTGMAG